MPGTIAHRWIRPADALAADAGMKLLTPTRGNLALSFIQLADAIDERRALEGKEPCIVIFENVPGLLSSKDNAFGCFLGALAGEDDQLIPSGRKWTNAGVVLGPQRAIAWRLQDAQYFGLAQRRRRVFLIASAREGFDPAAILLEFDGVRRDSPPSREAGEGSTHALAPCLTSSGRGVERTGDPRGQDPVVACERPRSDRPVVLIEDDLDLLADLNTHTQPAPTWWDGSPVSQTLDAVLYKGQTMPEKNRFPAVLQPVVG
jgi:DNA (cytosine-5)-methyltransferase 1